MYWMATAAAISAVSSLASGLSSVSTAKRNADAISYSALANANISNSVTAYNNELRLFNGRLAALAGFSNAAITEAVSQYNASLLLASANYNTALIEQEQEQVYSALDLDIMQFRKSMAQYQGEYIAAVGASGVTVGFGSNKEVLLQMKAEEALNVAIMRHNADLKWAELENAKRQGNWQAEVKARQIMYEGSLSAMSARLQGMLSLASSAASSVVASQQNVLDNTANIYNAGISAFNTDKAGQAAFVDSVFQASQYGIQAWGAYKQQSLISNYVTTQNINSQLESQIFSNPSLF